MISKILIATDGSKHAYRAAEKAVSLAKQLGEVSVTLFHVSPKIRSKASLIQANFDVRQLLEAEAHQAVMQTECLFRREGVPYQLAAALGEPAEEIVRKADTEGYDIIVIGSRGLSKLQELVMGSVSSQVAHNALCPVMIVK